MLKPIHRVACSPALAKCQQLMARFVAWLCAPGTTAASLTQAGLQPPVVPTSIEADWIWRLLQREEGAQLLLVRAQVVATMPATQKVALADWGRSIFAVAAQFQDAPPQWPLTGPPVDKANWAAFKTLMEAFYDKGFRAGLPYAADGTPVTEGGITYASFVDAFRFAHRLNLAPDARQICVFCGGPLGETPHVDHWVNKSASPTLSVCADNLTLICSICNEAPNKGDKPVHSAGSFADWFHPYLRPGNGVLTLAYDLHATAVRCSASAPLDQTRAANVDKLLNLASRWTREFKAEYIKQQGVLKWREEQRIRAAQAGHTHQELLTHIQQWIHDLLPTEPNYEVHALLGQTLSEPARVSAWLSELATIH